MAEGSVSRAVDGVVRAEICVSSFLILLLLNNFIFLGALLGGGGVKDSPYPSLQPQLPCTVKEWEVLCAELPVHSQTEAY